MMGNVVRSRRSQTLRESLGALSIDQALQQAMQEEGMAGNSDFSNSSWVASATSDVGAGGIPPASFSPNCTSQPAPNVNLFQTVSGLAVGTTGAGIGILAATTVIKATTAAITGAITAGVGVLFAVLDLIFAHHAAAVKQEQQLGCAAIAAANNSFQLIDQAVLDGQTTPDAASAAVDKLISNLSSYLAPSVGHNPCNADCEVLMIYKAIAEQRKSEYADMAAAAAQVAAPAPQDTSVAPQAPTWVPEPPTPAPIVVPPQPGVVAAPPAPVASPSPVTVVASSPTPPAAPTGPAPTVTVAPAGTASWWDQQMIPGVSNKILVGGAALLLFLEMR